MSDGMVDWRGNLARALGAGAAEEGGGRPEGVPAGAIPLGENTWIAELPGGRIGVFGRQYAPVTGEFTGYGLVDDYAGPDARGGGDPFAGARLAEDVRHNRETEAMARRQLALDTASDALTGYLNATNQIISRQTLAQKGREAAFSEARALLPMLVNPAQRYFSGLEPGGPAAYAALQYGIPFSSPEIQHKQLIPALLATEPAQWGEPTISPQIQAMLADLKAATGAQ